MNYPNRFSQIILDKLIADAEIKQTLTGFSASDLGSLLMGSYKNSNKAFHELYSAVAQDLTTYPELNRTIAELPESILNEILEFWAED